MITDLLDTEITDLTTLEKLPVGASIIDGEGRAWQRIIDGDWYPTGSDIAASTGDLICRKPLLVVWLPPEVTFR